jgi:type II secretory pathway pseudopilin PulG
VLIGVTLLGVGLTAAVTLWSRVVQRDREAELLFRGEAIVRALERFQQARPGTLPETLDELVEGKYLRRAWLDPMTGAEFRILRTAAPAGGATSRGAGAPRPTNPAGEKEPPPAPDERDPDETSADGMDADEATGITGVVSTSDLLSFRSYEGARRYNEWRFEAQVGGGSGGAAGTGNREPRGREREPR